MHLSMDARERTDTHSDPLQSPRPPLWLVGPYTHSPQSGLCQTSLSPDCSSHHPHHTG
jgi:hypothetical protein